MTSPSAKTTRPFVAAYGPVRIEPAVATARRVLGLLDDLPDGPPWHLAAIDGAEPPLASEAVDLALQLRADAAFQDIDAGILSSVVREGVALVRFALGHGQYGTADSVVITFSRTFDPVAALEAIVRHFDPEWGVCGTHELRSAQRPPRGSAPWLGSTTYLPGRLDAPAGARAIPFGAGTVIDFTARGTIDPDASLILGPAPGLLAQSRDR